MDVVVYDDEDRRYIPARVALLLALIVALLAVGLTALIAGGGRSSLAAEQPPPRAGTSAPQAGQADAELPTGADDVTGQDPCSFVLPRGEVALQRAKALAAALDAHTSAVDDLLARRITGEQLLARSLPVLTSSATDRRRFIDELAAYERVRDSCRASAGRTG